MAEIVSLNQYRKARRRAKAASDASSNRVRHGRTISEKLFDAAKRDLQTNGQDGKRLEREDTPPDTD